MNTKHLICIVGPTAIGKTALSIKLAQHFKTEIISADSRQFFKEMRIGTAVPTDEELSGAPHHFIQHISVNDSYSVGTFEKDALQSLNTLYKTHDVVVMVGGSGLYIDAVTKGLDVFPKIEPSVREDLKKILELDGLETLQEQLKQLDPDTYKTIALDNPQRVIRALEVCIGANKPYSSFLNKNKYKRPFKTIYIGLTADRPVVYNRINRRVDIMLEEGLLEEVKTLLPKQKLNALNTVGYKELFNYFNGDWTLDFAISEIKKNTRRFAKRQGTWFRKNDAIIWFNFETELHDIIKTLKNLIDK